jgi:hypothetical protein
MMQQMMAAGVEMACLYPGLEASRMHPNRNLFHPVTLEPLPMLELFKLLRPAKGGTYRPLDVEHPSVIGFASGFDDGRSFIYLLNKTATPIEIQLPPATAQQTKKQVVQIVRDGESDRAVTVSVASPQRNADREAGTAEPRVTLAAFSLTRVELQAETKVSRP